MNRTKNLAAQVAGAMAIAALLGTSAFAETRHSDATERDRSQQSNDHRGSRDGNRQSHERRDNTNNQSLDRRGNASNRSQTSQRNDARVTAPQTSERHDWRGNNNRFDNRTHVDSNRFDNRTHVDNRGFDRSQSYRNNRFDDHGRSRISIHGRVSRFVHERGGYRVWVDGGRYPVWIPEARISLFPHLRVGVTLGFGGYYDPAGYLEAYDYDGGSAYSAGLLRGVVETVDYRRGTLVLRDVSGNFVTTLIRDRRLETLSPGDYAEISGDWTRSGVFEGLRLVN